MYARQLNRAIADRDVTALAQHVIDGIIDNNATNDGDWSSWDDAFHAMEVYLPRDEFPLPDKLFDKVAARVQAEIDRHTA
jgi:hypothetical protein